MNFKRIFQAQFNKATDSVLFTRVRGVFVVVHTALPMKLFCSTSGWPSLLVKSTLQMADVLNIVVFTVTIGA